MVALTEPYRPTAAEAKLADGSLILVISALVRVRVWGDDGLSAWSKYGAVEAGLLEASDWIAKAIGRDWDEELRGSSRRPSIVRHEFVVDRPIKKARAYVTAHGLCDLELNGVRVGNEILSPGWTDYRERLRYYTYDVTDLIYEGNNAIGGWLGDGWYRGRFGFPHDGRLFDHYGSDINNLRIMSS